MIDLYDKISSALDRGDIAVGIFLDLLKAFDTVNHNILFDKLEHYGIRGLALKWVKSYFSNRLQFVDFNGHVSSRFNISCGVPQGSILGPLFFLLYINDIVNASTAGAPNDQFVVKCIIIPQLMKINVIKAFSGVFQCCWEKIICSFFPARHTRNFPAS